MFEEDLKVAKATLDLVRRQLISDMAEGNISPEELPLFGKVVANCEYNVKYYEEQVEKNKKEL